MHGRATLVGTSGSFDKITYRVIIDSHMLSFMDV